MPEMPFEDFGHEGVHRAATRREREEDIPAGFVFKQSALDAIDLTAEATNAMKKPFPIMMNV